MAKKPRPNMEEPMVLVSLGDAVDMIVEKTPKPSKSASQIVTDALKERLRVTAPHIRDASKLQNFPSEPD